MIDSKNLTTEEFITANNEKTAIAGDQPLAPVDDGQYKALYEAQKTQNEQLRATLTAAKVNPNRPASHPDSKPAQSAAQITAQLGNLILLSMTRAQKLATLGIVDSTVTDDLLRRLFGRGNDGQTAKDLMLTSPGRYRLLREAALLLHVYGT